MDSKKYLLSELQEIALGLESHNDTNMVLINNGKNPNDLYNIKLGIGLPANSPFGNLELKFMKIVVRLDAANRRIIESFRLWNMCLIDASQANCYERHIFANEEFVYQIRRASDEILSLALYLNELNNTGKYPQKIVDCIGKALEYNSKSKTHFIDNNKNLLNLLNEISNAYKHSFVNSDLNLLGRDEPCVHALSFNRNNLDSEQQFYSVSVNELIKSFNIFYSEAIDFIKLINAKLNHNKSKKT